MLQRFPSSDILLPNDSNGISELFICQVAFIVRILGGPISKKCGAVISEPTSRLTLKAGSHLGSYEVLGVVGAGGMGDVYRAWDSKLKREVAIKVLPTNFAATRSAFHAFSAKPRFWHLSIIRTSARFTT